MSIFFKIAFRNVWRNKRRTIITILAIFIGVVTTLVVRGFMGGLHGGIIDMITGTTTGDIQVHTAGYMKELQKLPLDMPIENLEEVEKLIYSLRDVGQIASRIKFNGMVSNGEDTIPFIGIAIQPSREGEVLYKEKEMVTEGDYLEDDKPNTILISKDLADSLNVEIGDTLTLVTYTSSEAINALDFIIAGLLDVNSLFAPANLLYANLTQAQILLDMEDQVTEIAIGIKDPNKVDQVMEKLRDKIKGAGMNLEADSWKDIAPFFVTVISIQKMVLGAIALVLFIVVATSIINTMLMAVFERTREIGLLMSMGIDRREIRRLFMLEALVIGLIGAIIGSLVGSLIVEYLGMRGITFIPPGGGIAATIYPYITLTYIAFPFLSALGVSLLSSLYPAIVASNLEPVEALRYS